MRRVVVQYALRRGHRGGMHPLHPPNQTQKGVDMTLDLIENHRQI